MNSAMPDILSLTRASVNWTAPELLVPDGVLCQPSVASDVYALAMVIYEVSLALLPKVTGPDQG